MKPDIHFSWNNHTMVRKATSQSGAAPAGDACAGSSGQAGLLPGKGVAEAHSLMHTCMNRDQIDTKKVISAVARAGLVANHCFLGREGSSVARAEGPAMPRKDSRGWMHTHLLINTPDTRYKKNQVEPQLNTNYKPSRQCGERQGPPTLLAE